MATMNVSLPDAMKAWVEARSKDGKYANASDYVRDLIRRDQEYRDKLERLQAALDEGYESAISRRTPEEVLASAKARSRHEG